ncbi:MAG: stage III sporulation protein AA [Clostridia bacterium]|nr:stage III sporulation protein AA [Clostridia bacterium]
MERWKTDLLPLLPEPVRAVLTELTDDDPLLEIRLRAGRPMELVSERRDRLVYAPGGRPMLPEASFETLLTALCERSVYAWERELSNGFLTVRGGYRVGVAGRAIRSEEGTLRYTAVNGFCIRIVRERIGAARELLPFVTEHGVLCPTLLISPPNCGKTTLLRDLIRIVSDGAEGVRPHRVCAADERFELCGGANGATAFDLGMRTDVVSGISKPAALLRMLAALSPQVLATDELHTEADAAAIDRASGCGVIVLATAHAGSLSDLRRRKSLRRLLEAGTFSRIVRIGARPVGSVAWVSDADGAVLYRREE